VPASVGKQRQLGVELVARLASSVSAFARYNRGLQLVSGGIADLRENAVRLSPAFRELIDFDSAMFKDLAAEFRKINAQAKDLKLANPKDKDLIDRQTASLKRAAEQRILTNRAYDKTLNLRQKNLLLMSREQAQVERTRAAQGIFVAQIAAIGAALVGLEKRWIQSTILLETNETVLNGLTNAYAIFRDDLNKTVDAFAASGSSRTAATKITARLTNANISLADSQELAASAAILSGQSFLSVEETQKALVDSILDGSNAGLKAAGIGRDLEKIYGDEAEALGIVTEALGERRKQQAILNYINERAARTGISAETATRRFSNVVNALKNEWQAFGKTMTTAVIPTLTAVMKGVTALLKQVNALPESVKFNISQWTAFATVVISVLSGLKGLLFVVKFLASSFFIFGTSVAGIVAGLSGLVAVVGTAAALSKRLNDALEEVRQREAALRAEREELAELERELIEISKAFVAQKLEEAEAQFRVYKAMKDNLEGMVEDTEDAADAITDSLNEISDALYDLSMASLGLDELLYPLQDQLFLLQAQVTQATIPLQRELRKEKKAYEELRDAQEDVTDADKERLDALKDQLDLLKEALQVEKDKVESIEHDIFMEELRNKILKRSGSARLLELRGQLLVQKDLNARKEADYKAEREKYQNQKDLYALQKKAAEDQISAAEKTIAGIEKLIEAQEELVLYQQEELELLRASQAEDRLRITQRERAANRRQKELTQEQTLIQRTLSDQRAALEDVNELYQNQLEKVRAIANIDPENVREVAKALEDAGVNADDLRATLDSMGMDKLYEDIDEVEQALIDLTKEKYEIAMDIIMTPIDNTRTFIQRLREANRAAMEKTYGDRGILDQKQVPMEVLFFNFGGALADEFIRPHIEEWFNPDSRVPLRDPSVSSSSVTNNSTVVNQAPEVTINANVARVQTPDSLGATVRDYIAVS